METPRVPVNRRLVGLLALLCLALAGVLAVVNVEGDQDLWQGAFFRVSVVLASFWLALPSRTREAAWANVPLWQVAAAVLGLVLVVRSRLPLQVLVPGAIILSMMLLVWRPRRVRRW
jgi:hypothetical protein